MPAWHIVSPEYPPQIGGVADYTRLIAAELACAGDEVHVWTAGDEPQTQEQGFCVHRSFEDFRGSGRQRVAREWDAMAGPKRILLQWVPHGFSRRGLNVPFCWWMARRAARHGDELQIMFHEVRVGWEGSARQRAASLIQRLMVRLLVRGASRLWISTLAWEPVLRWSRIPPQWLPVPANVPAGAPAEQVAAARQRFVSGDELLVGHFGTANPLHRRLLIEIARALLLRFGNARLLLIGAAEVAEDDLRAALPGAAERIVSTGVLEPAQIAAHLGACDLAIQPCIDGISTRRASAMAALANGCALVSTRGRATEPLWIESHALALGDAGDPEQIARLAADLMDNPAERRRLGEAGRQFYCRNFDVRLVAARLRGATEAEHAKA